MKNLNFKKMARVSALIVLASGLCNQAFAYGNPARGQGPVAKHCMQEIKKFCADKKHEKGEVRACLEMNKDQVSAACKKALETTGPKHKRSY